MAGTIEINARTLRPRDTGNEQVTESGLKWTTKSVLGHMSMQECRRLVVQQKEFVAYRYVYLASGNMYVDVYSLVDENKKEVASAVVVHMVNTWELAVKELGDRGAYMSYSQNKYDTKMLDICLDDVAKAECIESKLNGRAYSVLLRLHSSVKGYGRIMALVATSETQKFRIRPNRLWVEPCGYEADLVDEHLGLVVEPWGDDDKLVDYYTKLGFTWFNIDDWKESFQNNPIMRKCVMGFIRFNDAPMMLAMNSVLNRMTLKNKRTTFTKHILVENRNMLIDIVGD